MAYTYQKAEDHIRTGKFNTVSSPNGTLFDYGDHFANRLGTGYARDLLIKVTDELIARHKGTSTSRYSTGQLSSWEANKVGQYCAKLGRLNPLAPPVPYLVKIAQATTIDKDKLNVVFEDLYNAYKDVATEVALPEVEIFKFYSILASNTLTSDQLHLIEVAVMSCVLLIDTICKKAGVSFTGSSEELSRGTIALKLEKNGSAGTINITNILNSLNAGLLAVVGEIGVDGLIDLPFSQLPKTLLFNGTEFAPTSFKNTYEILNQLI